MLCTVKWGKKSHAVESSTWPLNSHNCSENYPKNKKTKPTYKSYDDLSIDNKGQVRDLGIMMNNTATFTLHIRNIVLKARDKMGRVVESVSVAEVLSRAGTLEISCHSPTRVLLPALESMEIKRHTSYRS